jgi:ABC-type Fe3+ transport system, permease component
LLPFIGIVSNITYDLESIINLLTNSYTHRIIYFSLYQAFLSAFISCLLAIPFALALNRHKNLQIVKIIISLCGFSFVMPSILIVYAIIKLFGYNGFFNTYFHIYNFFSFETIYGIKAILIAHILLNTPFATRLLFKDLNNIPSKYYEISRSIR